jgi:FixJ family two-component response regulator
MQTNQPEKSEVTAAEAAAICLVDDDFGVRKSVSRLLESAGFKAHAFGEPESFLAHLTTNPVPVVLSDIWMKSMTGMEVLAHLCARSPAAQSIVMQAGAFAFLIKPFNDEELLSLVRRALSDAS